MTFVVLSNWLPEASLRGIVVHWTAGVSKASTLDRSHYHILIENDGELVRGIPSIDLNDSRGIKTGYAAHTLNCNTGYAGVSLCGMAGAIEQPFSAGRYPITAEQFAKLTQVLADLCRFYNIPVNRKTVLSHAEVQDTLHITQRGKWDIERLPFDASVKTAHEVGDKFRANVAAALGTRVYETTGGIVAPVTNTSAHPTIGLRDGYGDDGFRTSVAEWQRVLGYAPLNDDGKFGPKTETDTKAWQAARGLTPDGVVGPATWAKAGL